MYLLIIFLPLFNLIISGFFGRFIGYYRVCALIILNMFLTLLCSLYIFFEVGLCNYPCIVELSSWIHVGLVKLNWFFYFDKIACTMLLLVVFVSFLVHLYSVDYMSHDPHLGRFIGYLSLFTFFMILLVTSYNFVQLFFGWEGVGLSSYLLINFWYTRIQANKSAMKAIIVNRFGDVGIYLSLILIFYSIRSFDYSVVFLLPCYLSNVPFSLFGYNLGLLNMICLFLFLGAVGKSAQIGLHTWLPDAMEGPTPVSALIHAATMVTAGVFVLIRCSPLLEYSPSILLYVSIIGGTTALFAGSIGMVQNDIKKVIAYSTCSQLGYMVLACGVSNYNVGLFHLFNHGFFKALLFLGAGSVIHALSDEQDMRKMGGLVFFLPLTYIAIIVGSLSLMGFPFLTGFYSKDVILEILFSNYNRVFIKSAFVYWLGVFSAFLTSFYSFRLLYLVFLGKVNGNFNSYSNSHESVSYISIVLFLLSIVCIFIGYIFRDLFVGIGTDFWFNSIFILPWNLSIYNAEFIFYIYKLLPVIFSFLGCLFSVLVYFLLYHKIVNIFFVWGFAKEVYSFFIKKWYFDKIYNTLLVNTVFKFSYFITFKMIDRGYIELLGPLSIVRLLRTASLNFSKLQTGYIYSYIFIILLAVIVSLFYFSHNILFYNIKFFIFIISLVFTSLFLLFYKKNK